MSNLENRQIVLASRPTGAPTLNNFRTETQSVPVPAQGEMLLPPACRPSARWPPSALSSRSSANTRRQKTTAKTSASNHAKLPKPCRPMAGKNTLSDGR
jgi:hypothetical protein